MIIQLNREVKREEGDTTEDDQMGDAPGENAYAPPPAAANAYSASTAWNYGGGGSPNGAPAPGAANAWAGAAVGGGAWGGAAAGGGAWGGAANGAANGGQASPWGNNGAAANGW